MSHMARLRAQRDNALNYYRNQHYSQYGNAPPSGMRARGMIVADGEDEGEDVDEDQIDSPHSSVSLNAQAAPSSGSPSSQKSPQAEQDSEPSTIKDDALQCPRCKKEYAAEEHNRFLEHIDECCS